MSMPTRPGAPIFTRLIRAELLALMKRLSPKPMSSVNESRADKKPASDSAIGARHAAQLQVFTAAMLCVFGPCQVEQHVEGARCTPAYLSNCSSLG